MYEASQWEQEAWKEDACEQVSTGAANVATWLNNVEVRLVCLFFVGNRAWCQTRKFSLHTLDS